MQLQYITVRMYCPGFGDCFLLTFHYQHEKTKHVWIDFGARGGDKVNMQRIAKSILRALPRNADGKPYVDVLVVTHEHQDHISGFKQASKELEELVIGQLWFAWTEDEKHPLYQEWREHKANIRQALWQVSEKAKVAIRD